MNNWGGIEKIIVGLFLVSIVVLSGCGTINVNQKIYRDGTFDLSFEVKSNNDIFLNSFKQAFEETPVFEKAKLIEQENGYKYVLEKATLDDLSTKEGNSLFESMGIKKEFRFPYYYYTITIKNKGIEEVFEENLGDDFESAMFEGMSSVMLGAMSFNYIIEPFGKITDTNGVYVGEDKRAVKFNLMKTKDYYVTFKDFFIFSWLGGAYKIINREAKKIRVNTTQYEQLVETTFGPQTTVPPTTRPPTTKPPPTTLSPTTTPPTTESPCIPNWRCNEWSVCKPSATKISEGTQTRICIDYNYCGATEKPAESQTCVYTSSSPKYTESDVLLAESDGKRIANNKQAQDTFQTQYTQIDISRGVAFNLQTPYSLAVHIIKNKIEKYDPYNLTVIRETLYSNYFGAASIFKTSKGYYEWDTSDLRAVIEYDNGKLCRSIKFYTVDSDLKFDKELNTYYQTTIGAIFDCYNEIYNKQVKFVFIAGNDRAEFNVNMNHFK